MKNQKWVALFALVTFVALAFTACEGPVGPAGAAGAAGQDGAPGAAGATGATGAAGQNGTIFVWKGSYANETVFIVTNGLPQNGWAYYNEALKQSLIYGDGAWHTLTAQGERGDDGDTPYIGENGNWWIGGVDTGVLVNGVTSISISGTFKTGYFQYESFTSAGLVVTVHYTDGSVATLNSGYHLFWDYQPLHDGNYGITAEPGTKTITVSWHEYTDEFEIRVFETSDNLQVFDTNSWNDALSVISEGGNDESYVIEVLGDVGVAGSNYSNPTFGSVSNVQVMLIGEGKLYLTSRGNMILIGGDQTLIIDSEDLTLEGLRNGQNGSNIDNNESVVRVFGNLELRNGTISGNTNVNGVGNDTGGGVNVNSGGNFTMSGGSIRGNTGGIGGAVNVFGSFTMNGGIISGNTATNSGAAVAAYGNFIKSGGGIIYGNETSIPEENRNTGGEVIFAYVDNIRYDRNTTLYEDDDISTDDLTSGWNQ